MNGNKKIPAHCVKCKKDLPGDRSSLCPECYKEVFDRSRYRCPKCELISVGEMECPYCLVPLGEKDN